MKPRIATIIAIAAAGVFAACSHAADKKAPQVTVEKSKQGAIVKIDGELFTEYITKSGPKPILYPIIGPSGKGMTRNFPMKPALKTEKPDHPHHRSFWLTHGKIGGEDFWSEKEGHGTIKHRKFVKMASQGNQAVIVTENDWVNSEGKKVCEDVRTLTFGSDGDRRWIDFDVTFKATQGDLLFGDDKEGFFGVRVAGTMKVDAKLGGEIVNSKGLKNKEAWGKPAAWVDYHGPVEGETLGIAILNHPASYGYPTSWHVRTYGLFTANPFGQSFFQAPKGQKQTDKIDGSLTVPSGGTVNFNYRVMIHSGDEKQGRVAEMFESYSKTPKNRK